MEGVHVNESSVGELKPIQTPRAWNKEENRMKSLTTSNQPSFSLWGMKSRSLAAIATVLIVAVAAIVGSEPSQAQGGTVAPQIQGSWIVDVTSPGIPLSKALFTFAAGSGLIGVDASLPPSQVTALHGTWVRKGGHEFAFTFVTFLFDPAGAFVGSFKVHETLTLEADGDAYNGVFTGEILDPDGNPIASFDGTTHATRINAE